MSRRGGRRWRHQYTSGVTAIDQRGLSGWARELAWRARPLFARSSVGQARPRSRNADFGAPARVHHATHGRSLLKRHPGRLPWTGFSVFGTMAPTPDNWISLDPSQRSADGTPGIALHVRHPPEAIQILEQTREQILALLARGGFEPKVRVWKIEAPGNSNHFGGSCRIHASPKFGMLDGWSRMHEVRNVVVADSSAFTTGPEKNPVLTSMTLAARASDRLAEELKTGDL